MNNKLLYIALIMAIIAGSYLEYFLTRRKDEKYYSFKDMLSSMKLLFSGFAIDACFKISAMAMMIGISNYIIFKMDYKWWVWVMCFLIWDLIHYFEHRLEHSVRLMWAIHVNHHSSPYMNLSTAMRSGVFKAIYRYFFQVPIVLLGFPLPMFITVFGINKFYGFLTHSRKLGSWKYLSVFFITPDDHAVHHSRDEKHYNSNFGEVFSIWDKIFGTYKRKEGEMSYGIDVEINHDDFREIVMHEMYAIRSDVKSAASIKEKILAIIRKPSIKKVSKENSKSPLTL